MQKNHFSICEEAVKMAVVDVDFISYTLKRQVHFKALIPTDNFYRPDRPETEFQTNPARTLYLLHGYTGCCNDFLYGSSIFQLAIQHNMAVIMPNGENAFYLEDWEKNEDFSKFVGKELVDFTRSMFRLSTRREDTYIGGMSMGGYGALINALRYPQTFSKVISISGAYVELEFADQKLYIRDFNSDEAYQKKVFGDVETMRQRNVDPRFCMEEIKRQGMPMPEIYFACGEQDFMIDQNRKLHRYMKDNEIPHVYHEGEGVHDWSYWNPHLIQAMVWLNE